MTKFGGIVLAVAIVVGLNFIFLSDVTPVRHFGEFTTLFRDLMWNGRALDVLAQMLVILAGTFGVLALTKERVDLG